MISSKPIKQIKQAIYFGPAQVVPFLLILGLILLQLLPAFVVADFGSHLRNTGVLDTNWEHLGAVAVIVFSLGLSIYWAMSGLFSLIIVSIPKTYPWQAWMAGFNLLHGRRPYLFKHFIFLILSVIILAGLVCLPFVYLIPRYVIYILFLTVLLAYLIIQIYLFFLYKALLELNKTNNDT